MLVPDPDAKNNSVDLQSASRFYQRAQSLAVPLHIVTRHLSHACRLPRKLFDALAAHGGPLGRKLYEEQRATLELLFSRACSPADDEHTRLELPARCDREWFLRNFCDGKDVTDASQIWEAIESIHLYGPIALVAALRPEVLGDVRHCRRRQAAHTQPHTAYRTEPTVAWHPCGVCWQTLAGEEIELLSATHGVLGLSQASPGVADAPAMRSILCQV
jgi:hypothetical protein